MRARLWIVALLLTSACSLQPVEIPTRAVLPTPPPTATLAPPTATPQPLISTPITPTNPPITAVPSEPPTEPLPAPTVTAIPVLIGSLNLSSAAGIAVRRHPSATSDIVVTVPGGTIALAQQRSADQQWIEVATQQGVVGWVAAQEVYTLADLTRLPVLGQPTEIAAAPTITPSLTITATLPAPPTTVTPGDVPAMERRLLETPILSNMASARLKVIFGVGQALGNRPDVFTTVGDSNTTNGDFLQPIGMDADTYCTWGDYGYLHSTVDFFLVSPSEDAANSFTHHSLAAGKGFSTAAVLDPFWATSNSCYANESPLACEVRTLRPSVVIIMLGGIDVTQMATADYDSNMVNIVDTSIEQGVIPVLTTFVVLPDRDVYEKSLEFNMALLDIAQAEQLPLINLWAAAQTLPDHGIGPDHTHLKAQIGSFCSFDGAQTQFGGTLRNLLTLQALDQLRQNVLLTQ